MSPIGGLPQVRFAKVDDLSLIYGHDETSEQAIERNKGFYISGRISLRDLERRIEMILKDHPDERRPC